MARDGSGTYNRVVADYVFNTVIDEADVNAEMDDIATALTNSLAKDGQTNPTANLPMATFRHTGVGNASARNDYAAAGQVQDSSFVWCGTAGGTANALTLTPSPAISAYATGQRFFFQAGSSASTSTVTVAISGLSATAVQVNNTALSGKRVIEANKYYSLLYDGTAFQITRLSPDLLYPNGIHVNAFYASGRLSLSSGVSVPTSDVTGATTLYYTPHDGNLISLYDTTASLWETIEFSQVSLSLSGLTASRPYDIYAYNNSGSLAIEGLAWTSATARATGLTSQNGRLVKNGDASRLYLGTIAINSTGGQANDSETERGVWNAYNRTMRALRVTETGSSAYATGTWRNANNDAANRLTFVSGQVQGIVASLTATTQAGAAGEQPEVGLAIDTSGSTAPSVVAGSTIAASNYQVALAPSISNTLNGLHFVQAQEFGTTNATFVYTGRWLLTANWEC